MEFVFDPKKSNCWLCCFFLQLSFFFVLKMQCLLFYNTWYFSFSWLFLLPFHFLSINVLCRLIKSQYWILMEFITTWPIGKHIKQKGLLVSEWDSILDSCLQLACLSSTGLFIQSLWFCTFFNMADQIY